MKNIFKYYIIVLIFFFSLKVNNYSQQPIGKINSTIPIKILPLGNSITYDDRGNDNRNIGEKAGYRSHLYNLLKNAGFNFDFIGSEHSGGNYLPAGYDENGGFPGISDDELFLLLKTGHLLQSQGIDRQVTAGPYLNTFGPDVILLHIGTNGNDQPDGTSSLEVESILDQIDIYENEVGKEVIVLLARIIDRVPNQNYVNQFNDNVELMALDRVNNPSNDAYPDKIVIVDMQDSAGIDYNIDYMGIIGDGIQGDMSDYLHPNDKGYLKMANQWFNSLSAVLPNPPKIISDPADYFSVEGSSANFSISVVSEMPVTYQWTKNGLNISLATDSILHLSNLNLSDNGALIKCIITNVNGKVYSNSAKLFVSSNNERVSNGLLAQYDFDEGEGTTIHNKVDNNSTLDLTINSSNSVQWITNGISIDGIATISTILPVTTINDSISLSNQFSFEMWFSSSQTTQSGPARIITISANVNERNFTFDQNSDSLIFRTRTTQTNLNGLPEFNFQPSFNLLELTHVVLTRNLDGYENIYMNGVLTETIYIGGDLSNWNSNYKFAIANEFLVNQPWFGSIYYVAFYDRKLNLEEIQHNYNLGEGGITGIKNSSPNFPDSYKLFQNYPNPFNPTTKISFTLAETSNVEMTVYNILGEEVFRLSDQYPSGLNTVNYEASNILSSGIYVYNIQCTGINGRNFVSSKKMIFLK